MSQSGSDEIHDHDRGLAHDLSTLLGRRQALKLFAGAALVTLGACGNDDGPSSGTGSTSTTPGVSSARPSGLDPSGVSCETIPAETAGPFPGDGSNGPNVLDDSGIVRRDIRSSYGSSTTTAGGVPLTVNLVILDQAGGCSPMAGTAVYLWHCDREGRYSLYSEGATDENYLRGVQEADSAGKVSFTSIFPAAYPGRWPHIHFEVYPSLAQAMSQGNEIATSQLALPEETCKLVYATSGYEASVRSLAQTSLAGDGVFRDGSSQQLATITGNVTNGLVAELSVAV